MVERRPAGCFIHSRARRRQFVEMVSAVGSDGRACSARGGQRRTVVGAADADGADERADALLAVLAPGRAEHGERDGPAPAVVGVSRVEREGGALEGNGGRAGGRARNGSGVVSEGLGPGQPRVRQAPERRARQQAEERKRTGEGATHDVRRQVEQPLDELGLGVARSGQERVPQERLEVVRRQAEVRGEALWRGVEREGGPVRGRECVGGEWGKGEGQLVARRARALRGWVMALPLRWLSSS